MQKVKIKIIVSIVLVLVLSIGITYGLVTGKVLGRSNNVLVTGDIYMRYISPDTLNILNLRPMTKEEGLAQTNNFFEFEVTGKNTSTKNIYYGITLEEGTLPNGKTRVNPNDLMIYFQCGDEILINGRRYQDYDSFDYIYVDNIPSNTTTEITKNYKLRVWLREEIIVSDTEENADYTTEEWENLYLSLKVKVAGNFDEKSSPYNYLAKKNNNSNSFWPESINNVKSNITEVNFLNLPETEINQRYQAASIKANVTDTTKNGNNVLAWLEVNNLDNTKYKMYVSSSGITYFPEDSFYRFFEFTNLQNINFENIDTSKVKYMYYMFSGCNSLTSLDLSVFDTGNVTSMGGMFEGCSGLINLDVSSFDTSQVIEMWYMFYNCSNLTELNLKNFNTNQVASMNGMFTYCGSLTNLDISNFNLSSSNTTLTVFNDMFTSVPATCQVVVKDTAARSWVLTATNSHSTFWTTSNVRIKS